MILPEELDVVPFVQGLDEPHGNRVAQIAELRECSAGTQLFRQGEESSCICFVLDGTVKLEVEELEGHPVEISCAGAGDLVGWSPVLECGGMTATARATTRCRLAVLNVRLIRELCESNPRFGMAFFRQIARVLSCRLSSTRRHLVLAHSLNQRSPFVSAADNEE
jgi:CRP-like cAMP-binding protein